MVKNDPNLSFHFKLGKTRHLLGHSSIGSIRTRIHLHSGVPPTTKESNKGGSVPVIWQKTRHDAYLEYTQNIMLQHQGEGPTGKPAPPYLQHYPYSSVSSRTPKRGTISRLNGVGSLLLPVYSEAWAKGNAEVSLGHQLLHTGEAWAKGNAKDPQNTIFLLTGRRTLQTCGLANQRC
ncbi:hypothetical protein TNCV_3590821 [Trichonephila clavipes]|nr:hypothetical protein TNCV_3590821 [Trichonephila clavipes]